jgi:hypothetical protein
MRVFIVVALVLLAPTLCSAHETRMYLIDTVPYEIIIGSVNEPVVVDDKTGVTLEIVRDGDYLIDAQEYLKVELIASGTSRVQDLVPLYGNEGIYRSKFIATEAVPMTYRVFGMLEGVPVDLSFACNPKGHQHTEVQTENVVIGEKVVQVSKEGMFSCPEPKENLGFPKASPDMAALQAAVTALEGQQETPTRDTLLLVLCVLVLGSLGLSVYSIRRK